MQREQLLGAMEVAARLGIGRSLAYELMRNGELDVVAVHRRRLVRESALTAYIEKMTRRLDEGVPR